MTLADDTPTRAVGRWWLEGNFAPVEDEIEAYDLEVTGSLPPEICGRFLRNGPNPVSGDSPHWFFGNGMLHGVRLRDGRAEWYRNRYVKTPLYHDPGMQMVGDDGTIDRTASAANTHVVGHGGRILALEEGHFPWEVSPDLETVDAVDFGGVLDTSFTAHPKICPETGEMLGFGYGFLPPYLVYYRIGPDGVVRQRTEIEVPGPTMMHDFNATRHHVVFMDLPVVFDLERALQGTMPYHWDEGYGARLGVLPREGDAGDIRWFDVEPCYVFHPLNAYEDDDRIVIDTCRYPDMWKGDPGSFDQDPATLHRWEIDLTSGRVREEPLDERPSEFPRVDERRVGLRHRFGYASASGERGPGTAILRYDLTSRTTEVHDFGAGRHPGEPVFVPARADATEGDGYVLDYVYDRADDRSQVVVLAAEDFTGEPLATVHLPRRVPYGFHGSFIPDEDGRAEPPEGGQRG
jgi:carotenoid cleavage dioxygenase